MSALMLLANCDVDAGQSVATIAATASSTRNTTTNDSIGRMLEVEQYDSVATVRRQCDEQNLSQNTTMQANTASFSSQRRIFPPKSNDCRNTLSHDSILYAKQNNACNKCEKYGRWIREHLQDGSFPERTPSLNQPITNKPTNVNEKPAERDRINTVFLSTITFNSAGTVSSGPDRDDNAGIFRGPLVGSGPPYSTIGAFELSMLSFLVLRNRNGNLDEIPDLLDDSEYWRYETGEHVVPLTEIFGSIFIPYI